MTAIDDIVAKLRKIAPIHDGRKGHDCIADAADEIERLRKEEEETFLHYRKTIKECDVLEAEIERLQAELDKWQNIAKVLGDGYSLTDEIRPALREVWIKFYSNSPAVMDAI